MRVHFWSLWPCLQYPRNASSGLCQCEKDEWKAIQKEGIWNYVICRRYSGWRLFLLASGFVLLLLAPNGMKLLPVGRKNIFYLSIYGSVLGAGSFLLHHFLMLVHSLLENFGPSVEMHTSVSILLLLLIIFTGAALGFWAVRKFVISEDGTVDVQFVKWSMQIMATTAIFQSTHDNLLALGALISCSTVCFIITSPKWIRSGLYQSRQATRKHGQAEFLSRSPGSKGKLWDSPKIYRKPPWSNSPVKGCIWSLFLE
ncbi:hypothetical protein LWI29_031521 [Acer saccharum]|uniref:Uncharacterized protein n=1 Tax=Acer saccharum TaxID=4024 RepID=A0AA39T504_ACESA|nr:hypothetical protein LWI29_031521 [Acer saccharum]